MAFFVFLYTVSCSWRGRGRCVPLHLSVIFHSVPCRCVCVFDGAPHWDHLFLAAHLHLWRSGLKSGHHSLPTTTAAVCVYVGVFACALKLFLFLFSSDELCITHTECRFGTYLKHWNFNWKYLVENEFWVLASFEGLTIMISCFQFIFILINQYYSVFNWCMNEQNFTEHNL